MLSYNLNASIYKIYLLLHYRKREDVGFEEVRNSKSHSSRYSDTSARMTPSKLSLGNKFGALTDQS